ncbi:Stage III sporulation protein AE [Lentibacillus sp. JNUCC-1]|uniref:stage III sporulation protein AE n=1 Tax=Lentibacillus sp. JNUCC-1 TaxID=2654513 RepID=UPI0012E8793F|nr:stage III sporulation protein AE [Lentibacillus sp. JNUCC-1]MUV39672.1 Stage III sporulation protein AE [Lentibacillus sp. JNUCC-1]
MKWTKYLIATLITCCILLMNSVVIFGETMPDEKKNEMTEEINLDGIQTYWQKIVQDYGPYIDGLNKGPVSEMIKGDASISFKNIFYGLLEYLFHELILNGKLMGSLLLLTLFSAVLQTMHNAFEGSTVSRVAYFVVYLVLIYLALNSFYLSVTYAKNAIDGMSGFMIALIPLVLGLMATFGQVVSVSFFHPFIIFLIHLSGIIVSRFIMPLLFLSALMHIVSSLNDRYKVTHLADLFKNVALGVLGSFMTIFIGVMSVQGAASAIQDGVAMKTAKFITGNFIPVVGRTLTDAADTMLSASLLLKNAVGVVGLAILVMLALFPAVKIFVIAFVYKLSAALLQPLGDGPVITVMNTMSKFIVYILACLLIVTFMFFLAIAIIVISSNITLLLR